MRSILVLLITLVMVTCTMPTSTEFLPNFEEQQYNQSPPTNGATVVIEDDTETWDQDGTIDGHIILTDFARLNIDANMTISEGSSITVEDNSQLFLYDNSSILSASLDKSMSVKYQDGTILIPLSESGNNSILFQFSDNVSGYGPTFLNGQGDNFLADDDSLSIYYNSAGEDYAEISISHQPYGITTIASIIVSGPSGTPEPYFPADLQTSGLYYCCQKGWSLTVSGEVKLNPNTVISGAEISVTASGDLTMISALLDASGPIEVNGGEVAVFESNIQRSFDDEDIRASSDSVIQWIDSNGTGGFVDRYTMVMGPQTISTPVAEMNLLATGLGWQGLSKSGVSSSSGEWVLEIPERIVSLQDSNGEMWFESATIQGNWLGPWGNFSVSMNLSHASHFPIYMPLPNLEIKSVSVEKTEASINSPVEVTVVVENNNMVTAENVSLDCTLENGTDTRLSPAYPILNVQGGEQDATVSFTWRGTSEGAHSLHCSIVEPNDWLDSEWTNSGKTSEEVTWQALVDAGDNSGMVTVLLSAMAIGIILAIAIAMRQYGIQVDEDSSKALIELDDELEEDDD